MFTFAIDYSILVSVAFLGILQVVAVNNKLKGLAFFTSKGPAYAFGLVLVVAGIAFFFLTGNRNIEGTISQVQGAQQFWLFLVAVVSAVAFTLLVASVINRRSSTTSSTPRWGLEALRDSTYIHLLGRAFKRQK